MDISEKVKKKESIIFTISLVAILGLGLTTMFAVSRSGLVQDVLESDTLTAGVENAPLQDVDVTIVPIED